MLGVGGPVQGQRLVVQQVERGDLEAYRLEVRHVGRILDRIVAEPFGLSLVVIALIAVDAELTGLVAALVRVVQSVAVRAVKDRIDLTGRNVDFETDGSVEHALVVNIGVEQLSDQRTVTAFRFFAVLAGVKTERIDALLLIVIGEALRALLLDVERKILPVPSRAVIRQRGFRCEIHGFGVGVVAPEL